MKVINTFDYVKVIKGEMMGLRRQVTISDYTRKEARILNNLPDLKLISVSWDDLEAISEDEFFSPEGSGPCCEPCPFDYTIDNEA